MGGLGILHRTTLAPHVSEVTGTAGIYPQFVGRWIDPRQVFGKNVRPRPLLLAWRGRGRSRDQ